MPARRIAEIKFFYDALVREGLLDIRGEQDSDVFFFDDLPASDYTPAAFADRPLSLTGRRLPVQQHANRHARIVDGVIPRGRYRAFDHLPVCVIEQIDEAVVVGNEFFRCCAA